MNKLSLLIIIFTPILMVSIMFFFDDITISLYVLLFVSIGITVFILLLINPFLGLLSIIFFNQFDSLIQLPASLTIGRAMGIIVAIGWFLKYFYMQKTYFFHSKAINMFVLCFIIATFISSLLAHYPVQSLKIALTISLQCMMLFFIQDFISDKKHLKIFIMTIAISAGIASLFGIMQYMLLGTHEYTFGTITSFKGEASRVAGFRQNPNGFASLLMSGIPVLLFLGLNTKNFIIRLVYTFFFLTSVIALCLTLSRTHFFGFAIFLFIYIYLNFRHKIYSSKNFVLLSIIVLTITLIYYVWLSDIINERIIGYTFSGEDTSAEVRFNVFLKSIKLLFEHPIFGIGFGNLELLDRFDYKYGFIYGHGGHDIVSVLFVSTGSLGILLFIALCYKTFKYFNVLTNRFITQNDKYLLNFIIILKASLMALLATCFGDPIILQRIFWIYIALVVLIYRWSTFELRISKTKNRYI